MNMNPVYTLGRGSLSFEEMLQILNEFSIKIFGESVSQNHVAWVEFIKVMLRDGRLIYVLLAGNPGRATSRS